MHTSSEEEDTDDRDDQGEDNGDEKAQSTDMNDDNIDEDTARSEKFLKFDFHSLAKSGTIKTVEEEFNLVTAKLWVGSSCARSLLSATRICLNKGLSPKSCFRRWTSLKSSGMYGGKK